jgi:tetratricopeptide (TPR) repeat protein
MKSSGALRGLLDIEVESVGSPVAGLMHRGMRYECVHTFFHPPQGRAHVFTRLIISARYPILVVEPSSSGGGMEPKDQIAFGMDLARQGYRQRARELIAKAVKADPTLKQGWWALAHLLEDKQQRIDCVRQVLRIDPENKQAQAKLQELMGVTPPAKVQEQVPPPAEVQPASERPPPAPVQEAPFEEPFQYEAPPPKTTRGRRRTLYIAVAVILLGALLIWLVASGTLQGLFGGSRDEMANLPAAPVQAVWTPTMEIAILVPTFSPTPSATQLEGIAAPTSLTSHTPTRTPTPRFSPTVTPTFDPRSVPTATRATPETCPAPASVRSLKLTEPSDDFFAAADEILAYMNAGGSLAEVRRALEELQGPPELLLVDLTNDGVEELILHSITVHVFGCRGGKYEEWLRVVSQTSDPYSANIQKTIEDFNHNGIQDILVTSNNWGMQNYSIEVFVYEWDGEAFTSLIPEEVHHPYFSFGNIMLYPGMSISMYNGDLEIEDVDANGTTEIILKGGTVGGYVAQFSAPQTSEIHTWMWNGEEFNFYDVAFSTPTLKIHAVQAGDVASRLLDFEEALDLYWQANNDPALEAWNVDRNEWMPTWTDPGTPTPTYPPPDPDQGARVEAYARFRIVVTNLLLGRFDEADAQYQNLLDLHPPGNPGNPFAQMASAFWEIYQATAHVADGCAAAREFADQNQGEILGALGWAVYGEASKDYDAEDICPF